MLKIKYRINEVLESARMIDSCLTREKGDISFLEFYMKKLSLTETEVKLKYSDIYHFYLNTYDDTVDLLKSREDLMPYLKLPSSHDDFNYIASVFQHLHVTNIDELKIDEFIQGCKFSLYSLDGTLAQYDCSNDEEKEMMERELAIPEIDFSDLFLRVNRTKLTDHEKITMLNLFQNMNTFFTRFVELYKEGIGIFRRYVHILEKYIQQTEKRLYEEDGTVITIDKLEISKYIDFNNESIINSEIILSISVMEPRSMSLVMSSIDQIESQLICGIFVHGIEDVYNQESLRESQFLEQMKALGDATRMKILKLLSIRPYYTKEISDETGLTPATVSHHMNVLLNARFVIFIGDGRKSYYKLNRQEMNHLSVYFNQLGGE